MLVILSICLLAHPTSANKPKRVITGSETEIFDPYYKDKDGQEYGFGFHPGDYSKLIWVIVGNAVGWMGVFGFKIYDKATGKSDQLVRDSKESRENWIRVASDIAYMKQHMVTESDAQALIREEIKYLREHKGKF